MKSRAVIAAVSVLAAASLACSINLGAPRLQTGPTETVTLNEPLPANVDEVDLEVNMAAGQLNVSGDGEGVLEGEIRYNVPEWEPELDNTGGRVTLTQGDSNTTIGGLPDSQVVNEWTLRLGDVPYNLTLNAGAYEGRLDLSGVPLRALVIRDGASSARVEFNSLNPEEMTELRYDTGASSVKLIGLGNANASRVAFSSGAGDYELDFTGDLKRDVAVSVKSGVSSVRLVVPAGANVVVNVTGGLTGVNTDGNWSRSGDRYSLSGSGPTITIDVDMGVGSLNLVER
jgi:hypothetical protein